MRRLLWVLATMGCSAAHTAPGSVDMGPLPSLPPILVGADAYREFGALARLRLGMRTYMRSTYDRAGGNEGADASHYLREDAPDRNVVLDVAGRGVLAFVRTNHWHGSPWHYAVDGADQVVSESSTATPNSPVPGSFLPEALFPSPLALTWATTNGADLNWVPMPFTQSFSLAYERTHYGTGYFIYSLVSDDDDLTEPIAAWSAQPPPDELAAFFGRAGDDLTPSGAHIQSGTSAGPIVIDGPAQLRALSFSVDESAAAALADAHVRITWDDAAAPSVDAPVPLLFGSGSLYNRGSREYLVRSLPAVIHFNQGKIEFSLYFPMPFKNRATIELPPGVSFSIASEPLADPPSWLGYFHASYVDHGTPVAGQDLILLDTAGVEGGGDYCGHLVGTSFIFSDQASLGTLEGDPRFFFDDSQTPQAQGTGTEEWGGGGDYWGGQTMTLPLVGHPVGAPSAAEAQNSDDEIESAYRFLIADLMPFGRNARIQLEHGAADDSTEHYQSVTYWYGRAGACLKLTDSLHVSDAADEAAHEYDSPTASAPEMLTSRYEWGVDHVGAVEIFPATTDSGRHMTGTSEFRVAIDPSNLGVLLRRKLDYGYADQRARVFVADDTPGASFAPAGTWYLAGSNRCVYSNPPGELDAPSPQIETSNRQWRDDELLLPRALTSGRSAIRLRIQFVPGAQPLVPGASPPPNAWSEYRYSVYSYILPP
jgi:Protein of unknown function (DUF2961)